MPRPLCHQGLGVGPWLYSPFISLRWIERGRCSSISRKSSFSGSGNLSLGLRLQGFHRPVELDSSRREKIRRCSSHPPSQVPLATRSWRKLSRHLARASIPHSAKPGQEDPHVAKGASVRAGASVARSYRGAILLDCSAKSGSVGRRMSAAARSMNYLSA